MHDTTSTKIGVCKEFAKSSYNTKQNSPSLERNQVMHGHFQFLFRITTVNFCPTGSPKPTLWSSFFRSRCLQPLHFIFHHYHELQHNCDILPALYFQKTSPKPLNIKKDSFWDLFISNDWFPSPVSVSHMTCWLVPKTPTGGTKQRQENLDRKMGLHSRAQSSHGQFHLAN